MTAKRDRHYELAATHGTYTRTAHHPTSLSMSNRQADDSLGP
jgi:hypothetical protein